MAGHFVLDNLAAQDLEDIQNAWNADRLAVPVLGALQHVAGTNNGVGGVFPGWTVGSRAVLANAYAGVMLGDRSGLPPHQYLDIGVNVIGVNGATYLFNNHIAGGWVTRILRPAGMGLTALAAAAGGEWLLGRKKDAFVAQLINNGISLEVYHFAGNEV